MTKKKSRPEAPTLADKSVDLSPFELTDLTSEQKRKLPKPRTEFAQVASQVLALYPQYKDELRFEDDEFDPDQIAQQMALAEELKPYVDWLERRLEQVKDTRLALHADSYQSLLKFYKRVQAAAEFNPQVGHKFAFLKDHFGVGRKNKKQDEE